MRRQSQLRITSGAKDGSADVNSDETRRGRATERAIVQPAKKRRALNRSTLRFLINVAMRSHIFDM